MTTTKYCHLSHAIEGRNAEDFNGRIRCRACSDARNLLNNAGCFKPSASLFEMAADGAFMRYLGWTAYSAFRPGSRSDRWSGRAMSSADSQLGRKTSQRERR